MDPKIKKQTVSSLSTKFQSTSVASTSSSSSSRQISHSKNSFEKSEPLTSSVSLNRRKPNEEIKNLPKNSWIAKSNNLSPTASSSSIKKPSSETEKSLDVVIPKPEYTASKSIESASKTSAETNLEIVKRRLNALKLLQMKTALFESEFYEELYLLECKYNAKIEPLRKIRSRIVSGEHEPTDDECNLTSFLMDKKGDAPFKKLNELESEREINRDLIATSILNYSLNRDQLVKGIPEFWLNVLKNEILIGEIIELHDEPLLKYLTDIDCQMRDTKPFSFKINFHFAPNEYFNNATLSKTYEFKVEVDPNDPYVYEAPEIELVNSCEINWKSEDKNVTKTTDGVKQVSFFHFFDASDFKNKDKSLLTKDDNAELTLDFELGYIFKEKIIQRAILYYMGEIVDVEQDFEPESDSDCDENDSQIKK